MVKEYYNNNSNDYYYCDREIRIHINGTKGDF
jgi:hypothetical protein